LPSSAEATTGKGRHHLRLRLVALPLLGSAAFLLLFAQANPLIGEALASLDLTGPVRNFSILRTLFWVLMLMPLWALLRPRLRLRGLMPADAGEPLTLPGVSTASVTLSLLAFNAIFALQNGLDVAFCGAARRCRRHDAAEYAIAALTR
jgi:hypothetical protein